MEQYLHASGSEEKETCQLLNNASYEVALTTCQLRGKCLLAFTVHYEFDGTY